jgi:hypothetical protein
MEIQYCRNCGGILVGDGKKIPLRCSRFASTDLNDYEHVEEVYYCQEIYLPGWIDAKLNPPIPFTYRDSLRNKPRLYVLHIDKIPDDSFLGYYNILGEYRHWTILGYHGITTVLHYMMIPPFPDIEPMIY